MRVLIQRVSQASVTVADSRSESPRVVGAIGAGMLILCGVRRGDVEEDAVYLAARVARLRIFNDAEGKMNRALLDTGGSALVVSQFTLHADTRKGNRPSYGHAAEPDHALRLYTRFVDELRGHLGTDRVATGEFAAMMQVALVNDGPVTVTVKSKSEYRASPEGLPTDGSVKDGDQRPSGAE
ncbi:MAG: D-aminoacyl-tRNA deacylase [Bacteroidota bacterium]|jgi:D-tyrosyl-tRNA(Tyr) deacylase|nr:D-aminoacyl-tRNA deacylase [Bacteroidota bacterium]